MQKVSSRFISDSCSSPMSLSSNTDFNLDFDMDPNSTEDDSQEQSYTKLSSSSLALLGLTHTRNESKMKIKTLSSEFIIPMNEIENFLGVKNILCQGLPIHPSDILLICNGKELHDNMMVSEMNATKKYFALLRTKASSPISLTCKENGFSKPITFSASTRIFHLKRELYSKKVTKLRPGSQRLIIGGRQLHDNMLLGDYLLQSSAHKKKMIASNDDIILHISKTFDAEHEVEISTTLANGAVLKFSMAISLPTLFMREILWRQYHIPKESELVISLMMKGRNIELHPDYTLIDYGVMPDMKAVEISIAKVPKAISIDTGVGLDKAMHLSPSPSQAILMAEQLHELEKLAVAATSSSTTATHIAQAGKVKVAASMAAKAILPQAKKRPAESENNSKSTSMFKGMKKGFFESKPASKPKIPKQVEEPSSPLAAIKRGFLLPTSPRKCEMSSPAKRYHDTREW